MDIIPSDTDYLFFNAVFNWIIWKTLWILHLLVTWYATLQIHLLIGNGSPYFGDNFWFVRLNTECCLYGWTFMKCVIGGKNLDNSSIISMHPNNHFKSSLHAHILPFLNTLWWHIRLNKPLVHKSTQLIFQLFQFMWQHPILWFRDWSYPWQKINGKIHLLLKHP